MKEQDAARREPNNFCVTKPSTCTMNYCDENGCQDRKRNLVDVGDYVTGSKEQDAAHSFDELWGKYRKMNFEWEWIEDYGCVNKGGCEKIVSILTKQQKAELTRLRSELQQQREKQFNLPDAAVFNLQQIALADDDMVKVPGAAEQYRFIARHILELFQKKQS